MWYKYFDVNYSIVLIIFTELSEKFSGVCKKWKCRKNNKNDQQGAGPQLP